MQSAQRQRQPRQLASVTSILACCTDSARSLRSILTTSKRSTKICKDTTSKSKCTRADAVPLTERLLLSSSLPTSFLPPSLMLASSSLAAIASRSIARSLFVLLSFFVFLLQPKRLSLKSAGSTVPSTASLSLHSQSRFSSALSIHISSRLDTHSAMLNPASRHSPRAS
jgi:hypothetical protein